MKLLTFRQLNISVVAIETEISLAKLGEFLLEHPYDRQLIPTGGWGYLPWEEDEEKASVYRQAPGKPSRLKVSGIEALASRFIFDETNRAVARQLGSAFDEVVPEIRYALEAIDVLFTRSGSALNVIIASHDEDDVNRILSALMPLRLEAKAWSISEAGASMYPTPDMFLWLLAKYSGTGHLSDDLTITAFHRIGAEHPLGKADLLQGISVDRVEVLGAVADRMDFGPAKLNIHSQAVGLVVDLHLLKNGTFALHRRGTDYDDLILDGGALGLRATVDYVHKLYPSIVGAYDADEDWNRKDRATFRRNCTRAIKSRYK